MGEYIVAFIDILGATEKIKSDDSYVFFTNLQALYAKAIRHIPAYESLIEYNIFSDNILAAIRLDDLHIETRKELIKKFFLFVSNFQSQALFCHNFLCRGAITIGELFLHNKVLVSGKALVRAYEMEGKVAIYPRIVLDDNVLTEFNDDISIRLCSDGNYMIDYFMDSLLNKTIVARFSYLLNNQLISNWGNLKVRSKIIWTINYLKEISKSKLNFLVDIDTSKKPTKEFFLR